MNSDLTAIEKWQKNWPSCELREKHGALEAKPVSECSASAEAVFLRCGESLAWIHGDHIPDHPINRPNTVLLKFIAQADASTLCHKTMRQALLNLLHDVNEQDTSAWTRQQKETNGAILAALNDLVTQIQQRFLRVRDFSNEVQTIDDSCSASHCAEVLDWRLGTGIAATAYNVRERVAQALDELARGNKGAYVKELGVTHSTAAQFAEFVTRDMTVDSDSASLSLVRGFYLDCQKLGFKEEATQLLEVLEQLCENASAEQLYAERAELHENSECSLLREICDAAIAKLDWSERLGCALAGLHADGVSEQRRSQLFCELGPALDKCGSEEVYAALRPSLWLAAAEAGAFNSIKSERLREMILDWLRAMPQNVEQPDSHWDQTLDVLKSVYWACLPADVVLKLYKSASTDARAWLLEHTTEQELQGKVDLTKVAAAFRTVRIDFADGSLDVRQSYAQRMLQVDADTDAKIDYSKVKLQTFSDFVAYVENEESAVHLPRERQLALADFLEPRSGNETATEILNSWS